MQTTDSCKPLKCGKVVILGSFYCTTLAVHECGIGFDSPVATFAKHFEQTNKVAERIASAREDVLFMGAVPHRPFTRAIEQIRQEQEPPDLAIAGRSETKLSASFKCRLF